VGRRGIRKTVPIGFSASFASKTRQFHAEMPIYAEIRAEEARSGRPG